MLLSTAYFPPVEYFSVLAKCSSCVVDPTERYQKQSWRNRCRILTEAGPMDLRFPIVHNGNYAIRDVLVDYSTPWVRQTEYALETAYCSSPFFEYYRDAVFAILDSHPATLWELNRRLTDFFCSKIGIPAPSFDTLPTPGETPLPIHPKRPSDYAAKPYWQVFRDRFGFVAGLSVADLLFNEGPESICYL